MDAQELAENNDSKNQVDCFRQSPAYSRIYTVWFASVITDTGGTTQSMQRTQLTQSGCPAG